MNYYWTIYLDDAEGCTISRFCNFEQPTPSKVRNYLRDLNKGRDMQKTDRSRYARVTETGQGFLVELFSSYSAAARAHSAAIRAIG